MRDLPHAVSESNSSKNPNGQHWADAAMRRLELDHVLARIEKGDLAAVAQPIIELATGRAIAYEGLVRWPTGNAPSRAAELFGAARQHGLTDQLERAARHAVLRGARTLPADATLFINCAPAVVSGCAFAGELERDVHAAGLSPDRVVVELTEQAEEDGATFGRGIELLRRRGFGIALDDFGIGASGLDRLMTLNPDWIKIDRSLVRGIDSDRPRARLIDAIARFASDIGVRIVGEGIETRGELRRVREAGIGFGQGFLLGRPGVISSPPRAVAA